MSFTTMVHVAAPQWPVFLVWASYSIYNASQWETNQRDAIINANFDQVSLKAIKVPYLHIGNKTIFLWVCIIYHSSMIVTQVWKVESDILRKTGVFPLICISFD